MPGRTKPVEVRAPARIDLAGGTVDIWPICLIEPGAATVNLAIDRFAVARARVRDDGAFVLTSVDKDVERRHVDAASLRTETDLALHREVAMFAATFLPAGVGLELTTRSEVPAGSGLGGSSALFVACVKAALAVGKRTMDDDALLRHVIDMEARLIGVPTGSQDYVSAIHGGLSLIRYPTGGARRDPIPCDLELVARRIVLVYTGVPHDSAMNNWAVTKAYLDGDDDVRREMRAISEAARILRGALVVHDLDAAADAIAQDWKARKKLAPGVTTREIERLGDAAEDAGAMAMKVCGAGGGGCVFFWCAEGKRDAVESTLKAAGADVLKFKPEPRGVR
jgi:D-glycero-alpha-D-manno-heptose-7-phosphate kinase